MIKERWLRFTLGLTALAGAPLAIAAGVHSHVPADTIVYSGMSADFPKARLAEAYAPAGSLADFITETTDPATAAEEGGPGAGMLAALYSDYSASWGEDERPMARFGMAKDGEYAFYTVGAVPVVRVTADDPQALEDRLEAAHEAAGIKPAEGRIGDVEIQRYPFSVEKSDTRLDLVAAIHDGQGILTLAGTGIPDAALATALGEDKPSESLADTGRPGKLADRHGLVNGNVSYVDQAAIAAGLADPEANPFGRMIKPLLQAWGAEDEIPFDALRKPACRKEIPALAATAPYSVSGFNEINPKAERVQMRSLVRLTSSEVTEQLNRLRGHIPTATDQQALFEFGLGLHIQEVVPALRQLSANFTDTQYECTELRDAQKAVHSQSIGQLGVVAATLGDTRGFTASLLELGYDNGDEDAADTGNKGGALNTARGVIEIATTDPGALWQLASSSLSLPADTKTPEPGGDPVAVDPGMGLNLQFRAAVRQNALLVLVGETPLPKAAGEKSLEPNGLLSVREDLGRLARSMGDSAGNALGDENAKDALATAKALNAYLDMGLDITEDGIAIDTEMGPTK
jgi:hypothetical protein